jgi:hypothetical protein
VLALSDFQQNRVTDALALLQSARNACDPALRGWLTPSAWTPFAASLDALRNAMTAAETVQTGTQTFAVCP